MTFETRDALVPSAVDPEISATLALANRLGPLKDALGITDLSDSELQLFAMVARHTGLDPFSGQIRAVKRKGKVTHQTGIDGYRSTAERTRQYAGSDEATYEDCDCGKLPAGHPKLARVVVHRIMTNGHVVDQPGIARWHELYPEGEEGFMWRKMPFNQLSKCAEANGLRKAFPRVLGDVYIDEEMAQAESIEGSATVLPSAAERIAARRAAAETTASTEATAEPAEPEPQTRRADGGKDEPPAAALTRAEFLNRLSAAGIDLSVAMARSGELFPGLDGKALTDGQRAELLADLTMPDTLPFFTPEQEAELDAAVI
jgi:phage recombination protein Bet